MRNKIASTFNEDSLEEQINDIEVFLTLYPDRQRIRDASIDLVVSIMKAVEDVIGFFLSSQGTTLSVRAGSDLSSIPVSLPDVC